jgi:hypothetical protein
MPADGLDPAPPRRDLDTSIPHPSRIYDYILGGKDNFKADRQAAARAMRAVPVLATAMRENRAVMRRMTAYLAHAGVRQFLDIGAGLPISPNMHEIAQAIDPSSRVLYVDNDPMVHSHARALLTSTAEGACACIDADAREPEKILGSTQLRETLDLTEPVALMFFGIMQFIPDEAGPHAIVAQLLDALPSGSYLALQHPTAEFYPPGVGGQAAYRRAGIPFQYRTREQFAHFLDGLELVEPGITVMAEWHAADEPEPRPAPAQAAAYAALGRKP